MDVGAVDPRPRCDICGKPGHTRRECWYQGRPGGRGKGKDGGKGKGKGKDGGKGKGKDGKTGGGRGGASTGKGGSNDYFNGECGYCGIWATKGPSAGSCKISAKGSMT